MEAMGRKRGKKKSHMKIENVFRCKMERIFLYVTMWYYEFFRKKLTYVKNKKIISRLISFRV